MHNDRQRTLFFQTCLGVFQGGGCRAAALVGAYQEAVRHGVHFAEVAGTSAGSIVAALIGAGATPSKLKDLVESLDFRRFLLKADSSIHGSFSPYVKWVLKLTPWGGYGDLLSHLGMYSSLEIERWIDEKLGELLPGAERPVKFESLIIPTSIITTDLLRRKIKIWSQKSTPDAEVARAVRTSCSIPLFFQPVDTRFVDGGMLSNLPAFVYTDRNFDDRPLASRILAFALKSDDNDRFEGSTLNYLKVLVNTIVDGGQELQVGIQRDVHVISIPTGDIKATDFEKMDQRAIENLIKRGTEAAQEFFRDELRQVKATQQGNSLCYGVEELYSAIVENLDRSVTDILIAEENTEWVYSLYPSLLKWRLNNVKIRVVLATQNANQLHESYRRRLLRSLGVEVYEVPHAPFRAFIFNSNHPENACAVVRIPSSTHAHIVEGVRYEGFTHSIAMQAMSKQIESYCGNANAQVSAYIPKIAAGDQRELIETLKRVPQYSRNGVRISIEDIPIESFASLTRYVREFKYRQIKIFFDEYQKNNLDPFEPAQVQLADGRSTIITPPVVEESGNKFLLIEGSTRIIYCRDNYIDRVRCVVVRGVRDPLPAEPIDLSRVRIVGRTLEPNLRYSGFNYVNFRQIEKIIHPTTGLQ